MILDRLTQRARSVLKFLPKKGKISCSKIIAAIEKSNGMGKNVYQNLKDLKISKNKKIDINYLIKESFFQAAKYEHMYVGTEHLLLALFKISGSPDFDKVEAEMIKKNVFPNTIKNIDQNATTPVLDTFGFSLSHRYNPENKCPLVSREAYKVFLSSLLLKTSPNVLLVGDAGVGKDTLIQLLAENIANLDIPPSLAGYQLIEFDILAFMTNLANKGTIDFGLAQLSEEVRSLEKVILHIKNFQNMFFASSAGFTTPVFYSMFKSAVSIPGVKIVATVNNSLFDKIFSENEHLIEDFAVIEVSEPTAKETTKILNQMAKYLGEFHNIEIPKESLNKIYELSKGIYSNIKFPQKGIDFLDHCCTHIIMHKSKIPESYKKLVDSSYDVLTKIDKSLEEGKYTEALKLKTEFNKYKNRLSRREKIIFDKKKRLTLNTDDVEDAFLAFQDERKMEKGDVSLSRLSSLAGKLKTKIIGQDEAVDNVARSLIRAKLGLRSQKRPLGNFLFLGPTGVGKTELAKVLAQEFFGKGSLIRLDMSDFSEKHNVARLVGAPPGYVGYGEGGELTSKIENNPNSVVLFDEIEKAHPEVLNILLQIMDEAELTDAKGTTFDFSKSVVILTSNVGTQILHNGEIGFNSSLSTDKNVEKRLKSNLKKILKPELLNRFDDIIVFKQLTQEDQFKILDLLLEEIIKSLNKQNIKLTVYKYVKKELIKKGYSKEYGARALRRTLEKELLDKIADYLLKHTKRPLDLKAVTKGGSIVIKEK